jgi:F-type H+-transporting ATPase subunit b
MQFFDEKFWIAISFLVFLYLVYKPIKNIILKSLDDQITLVKKQVLEAQKLNDEMARLYEDIVHQLDQFGKLKELMLKEGQDSTDNIIKKRTEEIDSFLDNKKLEVMRLIDNQKLSACQEVQEKFSDKIVELVSVYLKEHKDVTLDSDIAKKLIEYQLTPKR